MVSRATGCSAARLQHARPGGDTGGVCPSPSIPRKMTVPLSVLDLSPIAKGATRADALADSTLLAQHVESVGYHRYWVAEHHNLPGIASTSPAVLIAHLAAQTDRIRVGSGGVMLPNHPPLVVSEQFEMLEALHPGRIDLGIGRAPGTDAGTAAALRRKPGGLDSEQFFEEIQQTIAYLDRTAISDSLRRASSVAQIWLLGSSTYSAKLAGLLGLPFSFAQHINPQATLQALACYRAAFRPSARLKQPYTMISVSVISAETEAEAQRLLENPKLTADGPRRAGSDHGLSTPEVAQLVLSPAAHRQQDGRGASGLVGGADTVCDRLAILQEATQADEFIVATAVHDSVARRRSYALLAEAWARHSRQSLGTADHHA